MEILFDCRAYSQRIVLNATRYLVWVFPLFRYLGFPTASPQLGVNTMFPETITLRWLSKIRLCCKTYSQKKVSVIKSQWDLTVKKENFLLREAPRKKRNDVWRNCLSFAFDWLKEWREISKPITGHSEKRVRKRNGMKKK